MTSKLLVSVNEAAEMLSLTPRLVYELAANNRLEKRYVGKGTRNFRIPVTSLQAYVDSLPIDPVVEEES